jgi:hypothetical protein
MRRSRTVSPCCTSSLPPEKKEKHLILIVIGKKGRKVYFPAQEMNMKFNPLQFQEEL